MHSQGFWIDSLWQTGAVPECFSCPEQQLRGPGSEQGVKAVRTGLASNALHAEKLMPWAQAHQ